MAPTLPNLDFLKKPFTGLNSGFSTSTANSTPAFSGSMAIPKITPTPPVANGMNSQSMPLLGSPSFATPPPPINSSTSLTVPAGFNNPNSNIASNIATKTAVQYPAAPKSPTFSSAPTPTQPNINVTPSGTVVNAATGGTVQNSGGQNTYAMTPAAPQMPSSGPAATFSGPMYTSPEYEAAVKRYKDSMAPTEEENQNQLDLANLQASARQAYTNAEKQPIPLEFITGQQRRLQQSAGDLAAPLEAAASRLQAKRIASLEASKFALDSEADKIKAYREVNKPVSVGEGGTIINPNTGETIYSAPKKTTTADVNQDPARVLSVTEAKELGVPYGTTMGQAQTMGKTPGKTEAGMDGTGTAVTLIDKLLADENLGGIFGVPSIGAFLPGTKTQLTKNNYDQLKSMLSLEGRSALKGSGAISDFEFKVLEKAQSALGRNLSNDDAVATLKDLKLDLTAGKMLKDGIPPDVVEKVIGKRLPFSAVGNTSVSIPASSRLSYVNNNPGNLRFAGQPGAVQGEGGFAKFDSPEAGLQALENQIKLDAGRGHTIASFVSKFAPPTENDTATYIRNIATATSSSPMTPIAQIDIKKLLAAMAKQESGSKIT